MQNAFVFGRPLEDRETVALPPIRVAPRPMTALIGRVFIAAIFVMSGVAKLTDVAGTPFGHMRQAGIPGADTLLYVAAFAEILGGIAILTGFMTRLGALGLIVYLAVTTLIFHAFWQLDGDAQKMQMINFMKNVSIIGGLAMLVSTGAGLYSVDAKLRRPVEP